MYFFWVVLFISFITDSISLLRLVSDYEQRHKRRLVNFTWRNYNSWSQSIALSIFIKIIRRLLENMHLKPIFCLIEVLKHSESYSDVFWMWKHRRIVHFKVYLHCTSMWKSSISIKTGRLAKFNVINSTIQKDFMTFCNT